MKKILLSLAAVAMIVGGANQTVSAGNYEDNGPREQRVNICHYNNGDDNEENNVQNGWYTAKREKPSVIATHPMDFPYGGPVDDNGRPLKGEGDKWCQNFDACLNIEGKQTVVPKGYTVDAQGNCTQPPVIVTNTVTTPAPQVAATPVKAVAAGGGGGATSASASIAALVASVGTMAFGALRFRKFNV